MTQKWYVLPESLTKNDDDESHCDDGSASPSFYVHPTAGSVWPAARALPRRARGKLKR